MIDDTSITTIVAGLLNNKDSQLSSVDKNTLAEVLREVEIERQKATEERYRLTLPPPYVSINREPRKYTKFS